MPWIVVERAFEDRVAPAVLRAREGAIAGPAAAGDVRVVRSLLSRDGRHMVSLYDAPDAATVQARSDAASLPPAHLYGARAVVDHAPAPPRGHSLVVAQRDLTGMPGLSVATIEHLASDPTGCNRRLHITHFGAYLDEDLRRMVCTYYAPDLEAIRRANREAGAPWEHLWVGDPLPEQP